jgi:hypothetical protein
MQKTYDYPATFRFCRCLEGSSAEISRWLGVYVRSGIQETFHYIQMPSSGCRLQRSTSVVKSRSSINISPCAQETVN